MKNPTIHDPYPNYRPAGYRPVTIDEGTQYCIKPEERQGPGTPEHIKKYRKSEKNAFGKTITHYGKVDDVLPPDSHTYGLVTADSIHVPHVLTDKGTEGVQGYVREIREQNYQRNLKEPLGKAGSRNYEWPTKAEDPNFRFGVSTNMSESAKDVMYTPASLQGDEHSRNLYIKSHGMYEAGEQKNRNYNWKLDPKGHVFGKTDKVATDEMRYILQSDLADEKFPKTQIVKKNVEDFKDYNADHLGKVKNLAQTNPYITADHAFGYKPRDKEPWNVAKCIRGEPVLNQVRAEDSLGHATKSGFRNTPKEGDNDRVFGVPTIRNDIKKPAMRSVADTNNYGDEPASVGLLFPQRFADLGVDPSDFEALREKEVIRKMFANIGYAYKPGKFEGLFQRAQQLCGIDEEYCSAGAFIQAIKEMGHLE